MKAVACGPSDNIYITGSLDTNNGPATSGSHQSAIGGGYDAFLAKFDSTGKRVWGTYYGGSNNDTGLAVTCDANENIYIGGYTYSTNSISTTGSHQPAMAGTGSKNGFLVKFDSSGVRQWATYYGNADTKISSVVSNASGDVYISGSTSGTTLISTTGAYQASLAGYTDCFLAKFNSSGVRQWGTYFGGSFPEDNGTVAVSISGKPYLAGITSSSSGIATTNGYQTSFGGGGYDNFIAEFTPTGNVTWASYYGGSGNEYDHRNVMADNVGLTCGKDASLYLAFATTSTSDISYNGFQNSGPNYLGDMSAFLVKFLTDTTTYVLLPYNDTLYCAGDSIRVPFGVTDHFEKANTFMLQLSDAGGSFASPVTLATRADSVAGTLRGRIPPNTPGGTGYKIRISSSLPSSLSYNEAPPIHIKPAVLNFSLNSNSPVCDGDTIRLTGNTTSPLTGVVWQWNGPGSYSNTNQNNKIVAAAATAGYYKLKATLTADACALTDSILVTTKRLPGKPIASSNTPVCFGDNINLTATDTSAGVSYSWIGPHTFSSALQNPIRSTVSVADSGDYIVTATLNGCIAKDTETVLVYHAVPAPIAGSNSPVCTSSDINLTASTVPGATYAWTGVGAYTANAQNPAITGAALSNSGIYSVVASLNGCFSPAATTVVSVVQGPIVSAYPSPGDSICTGKTITLNALITGAVTSPAYQWLKNGNNIPGANKLTYTDNTTVDGDIYSLILTPGTGSVCTTPIQGSGIPVTVLQYKAPVVTVTATDTNAWSGLLVNFIATPADAGTFPKYQWKLNNKDVQGATSYTWGAATLSNGDNVCVEVTSTYMCPRPLTASTCHVVKIATGIHDVNNDKIHIYPNPAGNELHVDGLSTGTRIQLSDVYGRVVYSSIAASAQLSINTANLIPGDYILQLTDVNGAKNSYKVVKE